jgi:hypothetical protein
LTSLTSKSKPLLELELELELLPSLLAPTLLAPSLLTPLLDLKEPEVEMMTGRAAAAAALPPAAAAAEPAPRPALGVLPADSSAPEAPLMSSSVLLLPAGLAELPEVTATP